MMDYLALPVPWESPKFLISQLPGTQSSPAGGQGEAELCWGAAEGVGVSQGKNQRAQISAREGIPIFCLSSFVPRPPLPQQRGIIFLLINSSGDTLSP